MKCVSKTRLLHKRGKKESGRLAVGGTFTRWFTTVPCNDCAHTCMSAAVEAQVADFAASPLAAIEKSIAWRCLSA